MDFTNFQISDIPGSLQPQVAQHHLPAGGTLRRLMGNAENFSPSIRGDAQHHIKGFTGHRLPPDLHVDRVDEYDRVVCFKRATSHLATSSRIQSIMRPIWEEL